jgi:hypothetical protein
MSAKDTEAQIDVQAMTRDEAMLVLTNLANTLWQHNPRTHRAIKVTLDAYEAQVRENAGRQRMQELREKDVARLTAALAGCQEERDKQYDAAREVIDRQAAALAGRTAEGNVLVARLGETEAALAEARSKTELRDRELDTMSRIATKYQKERDEARKERAMSNTPERAEPPVGEPMGADEAVLVLTNLMNLLWPHNPRSVAALRVVLGILRRVSASPASTAKCECAGFMSSYCPKCDASSTASAQQRPTREQITELSPGTQDKSGLDSMNWSFYTLGFGRAISLVLELYPPDAPAQTGSVQESLKLRKP